MSKNEKKMIIGVVVFIVGFAVVVSYWVNTLTPFLKQFKH